MTIKRRELPNYIDREWSQTMRLSQITLYGREGDLNCQLGRVHKMCRGLNVQEEEKVHILQPPATLEQKGWRRVTDKFASPGLMTFDAEGAVLPGKGHCLVIPTRGSYVVYAENIKNKRVGAARVKTESLTNTGECCGPENVIQALLNKLEVTDGRFVEVFMTGGGPPALLLQIADVLGKWGVKRSQVDHDGLTSKQMGLGDLSGSKPEQNWAFIHQTGGW